MRKVCYFVNKYYIFVGLILSSGEQIKMFRAHNKITLRTYLVIRHALFIFLVYTL
jgi:hypothetical protein